MKTLELGSRIALNRILFATDFSPYSNAALPFALAIAHQYSAKLFGVHVMPTDAYVFASPESWPAFIQEEELARQGQVARLDEQLRGIEHEVFTSVGGVWEEISRLLREQQIDLLVVGTHGRTGARKLLMGSVAEQIFRQATCPVLTVGPNVLAPPTSVAEFKRIVFATDFGEEAHAAAAYATSLAQEHQARLSLVHVLNETKVGTVDFESNADFVRQRLHGLVPPETGLWCNPEYFVEFGPPAEQILRFADMHRADLIVMGARAPHGSVGVATHFSHTTVQHIVAHAKCPVLTVRG